MITTSKKTLFYVLILSIFIAACGKDKNIPDVSAIPIDLNIQRFEQDFFQLDTNNLAGSLQQLEQKYPVFSELFFTRVLPLKRAIPSENPEQVFHQNIKGFLGYPSVQQLYDTCKLVFPHFQDIKPDLKQAFQFYKHYFPDRVTPTLYTFVSEYTYQTFIFSDKDKDAIGIGLDMFLGRDYPYIQYIPNNPAFSSYLTRTFNKEHLVKKCMDSLIDDLESAPKGTRLLDEMIHHGKKLYILDQLLPYTPDSIKLEYTTPQTQWVQENEFQIWSYFLDEKLLYSSEGKKIRKLINPSPHANGDMPPEAPGKTANWIGWQIVKAYMKRHPETSLSQLLALDDPQQLMDKARYRPK